MIYALYLIFEMCEIFKYKYSSAFGYKNLKPRNKFLDGNTDYVVIG